MQYLVDSQDLHNYEYFSGELLVSEIVKIRRPPEGGSYALLYFSHLGAGCESRFPLQT